MTGPMSGVDPDQVDADSGMFWRTLYKLEKNFSDMPEPFKMAQKASYIRRVCIYAYHP